MVTRFTEPVAIAMRDHKLNDPVLCEKEVRAHPQLPPKEEGNLFPWKETYVRIIKHAFAI